MDKNEKYVRSAWEPVLVWTNERTGEPRIGMALFMNWSAAAEFTREHKEQVRQLRRQISLMKEGLTDWAVEILLSGVSVEMSADLMNAEYVRDECTGYFVLARLEAELTRLTAGMKKEVGG